ncbi:MAG: TIGR02757 family protein [Thermodesulfobacteriota bacterium]
MTINIKERRLLKRRLELLYRTFDLKFLSPDPLEFVHKFKSAGEREVVGIIASSLAYGRVAQILASIERVMELMDHDPLSFILSFEPKRDMKIFRNFKHRFNDGKDLACLIYFARQMIDADGSIGAFFLKGYSKEDETIKEALENFTERALALDGAFIYKRKKLPKEAGVRYFFPSPAKLSACKRLNLYLRWMVRRGDSLDFGLWRSIDPAKLIIPLDTHIARISANIGLTARKTADWRMAEEITSALRELDPKDPVKYDFSLARLGILEKCPKRKERAKCEACLIREICVL